MQTMPPCADTETKQAEFVAQLKANPNYRRTNSGVITACATCAAVNGGKAWLEGQKP
jgi:hypothetical protein